MAHIIQLALGPFVSNVGVKGRTNLCEAHERDQQFGENESKEIGKCQRLRKQGNARINKVLAIRPGLATIIEKVRISRNVESPETDLHIAANAGCIDYTDTGLWKWVQWMLKTQCTNHSTSYCGCKDMAEFHSWGAWLSLPMTRIHPRVSQKSKIQW